MGDTVMVPNQEVILVAHHEDCLHCAWEEAETAAVAHGARVTAVARFVHGWEALAQEADYGRWYRANHSDTQAGALRSLAATLKGTIDAPGDDRGHISPPPNQLVAGAKPGP